MNNDHKTVREALEAASSFIKNGVALGYISLPEVKQDPALQTLPMVEKALAALDRIEAVETVTVEEYAERMRGAVVLNGQYSYCYGRDTAKVFPNGLRIVQSARKPEQPAAPINQAYEG